MRLKVIQRFTLPKGLGAGIEITPPILSKDRDVFCLWPAWLNRSSSAELYLLRNDQVHIAAVFPPDFKPQRCNRAGFVVGEVVRPHANPTIFTWIAGKTVTHAMASRVVEVQALDINESGQVAGSFSTKGNDAKGCLAYVLDPQKGFLPLKLGTQAIATNINAAGMVIGYRMGSTPERLDAFIYNTNNGSSCDISVSRGGYCSPAGLNDKGQVFGSFEQKHSDISGHFLWYEGKTTLVGPVGARILAINNLGETVGSIQVGQQSKACVWREGVAIDLNKTIVGWSGVFTEAIDINDKGYILAWSRTPPSGARAARSELVVLQATM